ncbi:ATP-binding cassette domain-containing protein [Photobacterium makurazakiensis]|uniref:peptidase domain-containing ABC transporter n=1 Tax=Photobacterium makurazakiensis TaxID=2910234 RepID=UPI003D0E287C
MQGFVNIADVSQRLKTFNHSWIGQVNEKNPLVSTMSTWLVAIGWEGTAEKLADFIILEEESNFANIEKTFSRLGYKTSQETINLKHYQNMTVPFYIEGNGVEGLVVEYSEGNAVIWDPYSGQLENFSIPEYTVDIIFIDDYSRYYKEPPPQTADKSNWLKHAFLRYKTEINLLLLLSFFINLMGLVTPLYIMSIYNLALTSGSLSTLGWIAVGASVACTFEFALKNIRLRILASSGRELAETISYEVFCKLIWLPYRLIKNAGVTNQIARVKDIDQFRKLVTSTGTLAYLDLPFIVIFIGALVVLAGSAALVTLGGIVLFIGFGFYARFQYQSQMMKSSRANSNKQSSWFEILSNLRGIKSLPLAQILKVRFDIANGQSAKDSYRLAGLQGFIGDFGAFLTQFIGVLSIVVTVEGVLAQEIEPGVMIAMVMLVWKALGPLQAIYNTIIRMKQLSISGHQVNRLMGLDDERASLSNTLPIEQLDGNVELLNINYRYAGTSTGLSQINANFYKGDIVTIVGPSGSGKSTLLRIIAGLYDNYQGKVVVDSYNLQQFPSYVYRNAITYIPQDTWLYNCTVRQNFMLAVSNVDDHTMESALNSFGLDKWLPHGIETVLDKLFLDALPSGIKVRLKLSMAFCKRSGLVILDEPGLGLDVESSYQFRAKLKELSRGATVVVATRNTEYLRLSDKALLLDEMGNQKYFGASDKVITSLAKQIK